MTNNVLTEKESQKVWSQGKVRMVAGSIPHKRNRALFVLEYLTAGRIGEIAKRVQKSDFEIIRIENQKFLQISNFYTEKNKKHPKRELIVPIEKEQVLVDMFLEYLGSLNDQDVVFNKTRQRAWQIIRPIILANKPKSEENRNMNANHYLRHVRNSHLVNVYGFNEFELQEWNGWSDTKPARFYVQIRKRDIARKMLAS